MDTLRPALAFALTLGACAFAAAADPARDLDCSWSDQFWRSDFDDTVEALAVFDDGAGPALYAGGWFHTAGGTVTRGVARWSGTRWEPLLGPSGESVAGGVNSLAVFDDGSGPALYAGGHFAEADGLVVNHLARWDGSAWAPVGGALGAGVDGPSYPTVNALAVFDDGGGPALYVGGRFDSAGAVPATNVARWNGSQWSAVSGPSGEGTDDDVLALAAWNDSLYVGGSFVTAGGVTVNMVARWDALGWSPLSGPAGTGVSGLSSPQARAFAVFDGGGGPELYVGGFFSTAGGRTVNSLARWNGTRWAAAGLSSDPGVSGGVQVLLARSEGAGNALYVGGSFFTAGGLDVNGVARWDGQAWSALPGPSAVGVGGEANALAAIDDLGGPQLVIGGRFLFAGGEPAHHITRWDGALLHSLSPPGGAGLSNYPVALATHDDGSGPAVYAAGRFTYAGETLVNNVARWDDGAWMPLAGPAGVGSDVNGFLELESCSVAGASSLFGGGYLEQAGGVDVNHVARWDGVEWSPLAGPSGIGVSGLSPKVFALACLDPRTGPVLYAGGVFDTAGGLPANAIARWDGSSWSPLGTGIGLGYAVLSLAVSDQAPTPLLFVGGDFETAGGLPASNIAQWDGGAWSALEGPAGNGVDGWVWAMAVFDPGTGPELFVAGEFATAGGLPTGSLARWDGQAWSEVPGFAGLGLDFTPVGALTVHDDGQGPALYVTAARAMTTDHSDVVLLRWNGTTWSALVDAPYDELGGAIADMTSVDDGSGPALWLGGPFHTMGGHAAVHVTRYWCDARLFADDFETGTADAWSLVVP